MTHRLLGWLIPILVVFFGIPLIGWFKTLLVLIFGIWCYKRGEYDERQDRENRGHT